MHIAIPTETYADERRVALVPAAVPALTKLGMTVSVQRGAGLAAGYTDEEYEQRGATLVDDRVTLLSKADIVCQVRCLGANPDRGPDDLAHLKPGAVLIGHADPLIAHEANKTCAERGLTLLALELVPRITRAQAMDVLSSQANLVGYKAVLMAADALGKTFPMMMTAAGTLKPAKVFIVGVGVAGLQAIATAKRLGAVVSAIDVRPETKEQVESLGAKFIEPPETASGEGGYAAELTDDQKRKQQELMADTVAESDVVVTTAAIPGKRSPVLITDDVVARMKPGSVIVDLAAERGGNVQTTEPGRVIKKHGVTVIGTNNIPSYVAADASAMYSGNVVKLMQELVNKEGEFVLDPVENEIAAGILVCRDGEVVNPQVRGLMGLPELEQPEPVTRDPEPDDLAKPQAAEGSDS